MAVICVASLYSLVAAWIEIKIRVSLSAWRLLQAYSRFPLISETMNTVT
jgi:hypothetical protein